MFLWLFIEKSRYWLLLVLGSLLTLSAVAATDECSQSLGTVHARIEKIRSEIEQIQTRFEYEESLKGRYDTIESLLHKASYCIEHETVDKALAAEWGKIKRAMASLRATAQESAFTKFNNWIKARESDLNALKEISNDGQQGAKSQETRPAAR